MSKTIAIEEAKRIVAQKRTEHLQNIDALESGENQWLEEQSKEEYRKRLQTAKAWVEITENTIDELCSIQQTGQDEIQGQKFLNIKREELKKVYESGDYPYSDLPEPKA